MVRTSKETLIDSLRAKKFDVINSKDGFSTALDLKIVFSSFSAFSNNFILKTLDISLISSNLYVNGPIDNNLPSWEKHNS